MRNKKTIYVFIFFIIIIFITMECIYFFYEPNNNTKSDDKEIKEVPLATPVESFKEEDKKNIPTELDENTQKLVDKIAANINEKTTINDAWIFYVLIDNIIRNTEVTGYDNGDIHKISKDEFKKQVKFISKEKNINQIINIQNNKDLNYYNYKIKEDGNYYLIITLGQGMSDNHVELTNKEVENNKLILTYKVSCYNGDSSNYYIGETTVTLDYIDNTFYLDNASFKSNGLDISCYNT